MVIGADVVRLPDESVETAVSVCLPSGSEPLIQSTVPEQLALAHDSVFASTPLAYSWTVFIATLSVPFSDTLRLLPVHVPLGGLVMAAVGGTVSVVPPVVLPVVVLEVELVAVVVPVAPEANVGLSASL